MVAKPRRSASVGLGPLADMAKKVADQRLILGLTQKDLAVLAEVSETTIRMIERGRGGVRLDGLSRVLHALGLALAVVPPNALHNVLEGGQGVIIPAHGHSETEAGAR